MVVAEVQVRPPGLAVTVYPVMAAPPVEAGAVQEAAADVAVAVATRVTPVGAPGTVATRTAADGVDDGLAPRALAAVTVNV